MLKILHTSDLHLGKSLYNVSRYDEFLKLLTELKETIVREQVDVLLIAGDVFDTTLPTTEAQRLYYTFLRELQFTPLKHTVIIAGNHDSPAFLNAPRTLLETLCHVSLVHCIDALHPEKEVLVLKDEQGVPYLIVAATPYIREREIRRFYLEEDETARNLAYRSAVADHLKAVADVAFSMQAKLEADFKVSVPAVAMAHLFTAGGISLEDDGVRELFVGSLSHIDASAFDTRYAYVALGHLHVPQQVNRNEFIQYSGTPLPMGFSEIGDKHFVLLSLDREERKVSYLPIPRYKQLCQVKGDLEAITSKLAALRQSGTRALVEIIVTGQDVREALEERIATLIQDSELEVVRIKDQRVFAGTLSEEETQSMDLSSLNEETVFLKRLDREELTDEERASLIDTYHELRVMMNEQEAEA